MAEKCAVCERMGSSCWTLFSGDEERRYGAYTHLRIQQVIHRNLGSKSSDPLAFYRWDVTENTARKFLRPDDVAEILTVSVDEVYALLNSGELLGIRVGTRGTWRIEAEQLDSFIADAYEFEARAARWRQAEHANITEVADGRIL